MKGRIVFLLTHLRTLFTASFIALAIVACGGSSGDASPAETPSSDEQPTDELDDPTTQITEEQPNSEVNLLDFEFMREDSRLTHSAYASVRGNPEPGEAIARLQMSEGITDVTVSLVDMQDNIFSSHEMKARSTSEVKTYYGRVNIPESDFYIFFSGKDSVGDDFSIRGADFSPQRTSVGVDAPAIVTYGDTFPVEIKLRNAGVQEEIELKIIYSNLDEIIEETTKTIELSFEHTEQMSFTALANNAPYSFQIRAEIISSNELKNYDEHVIEVLSN